MLLLLGHLPLWRAWILNILARIQVFSQALRAIDQ